MVRKNAFTIFLSAGVFAGFVIAGWSDDKAATEVVEEDVKALSRTYPSQVKKWDMKECQNALTQIQVRMKGIQKEKHLLYRDENKIKNSARSNENLPEKYKELAAEIKQMKKELREKTIELGKYMNNLDEVKELRDKHKELDDEWRKLSVLKSLVDLRKKDLRKSGKAGIKSGEAK